MFNLLAKWFNRPEQYDESRYKFFKKVLTSIFIGTFVVFEILYYLPYTLEFMRSGKFMLMALVIMISGLLISYIRDRNKNKVKRDEEWWKGKGSKWNLFIRM